MMGFDALGRLALGQATDSVPVRQILTVSVGSFAAAGSTATFSAVLSAPAGAFLLGAPAVAFDPTEVVSSGRIVWTGSPAYLSWDFAGGGSAISGGTFSRGKWRALQDEIAAERKAKRKAAAAERDRRRAAALAAAAA